MKNSFLLEFDAAVFSVASVQKACHRFTNIASFEIRLGEKQLVLVTVTPLSTRSDEGQEQLGARIRNEVLDQSLREQIREQTEGVRNLVLAHAFSRTGLIVPDGAPPQK